VRDAKTLVARVAADGTVTLQADGRAVASGSLDGLVTQMPQDGLQAGQDTGGTVGDYPSPFNFGGKIRAITVELSPVGK